MYGGYNLHSTSNLHSTEDCIQSSCNTVLWFNLHFTFENVDTFKSALWKSFECTLLDKNIYFVEVIAAELKMNLLKAHIKLIFTFTFFSCGKRFYPKRLRMKVIHYIILLHWNNIWIDNWMSNHTEQTAPALNKFKLVSVHILHIWY